MQEEVVFRGLPTLQAQVAKRDLGKERNRVALIDLLVQLLDDHVRPVAPLLHDAGEGVLILDEEAVAGTSITGLLLSLLAQETPTLDVPDDGAWAQAAFGEVDIDIADPERAHRTYRVWQARRALAVVAYVLDRLSAVEDLDNVGHANAETERIAAQMTLDLPDRALRALARFVSRRGPAPMVTRLLESSTTSPRVQRALATYC